MSVLLDHNVAFGSRRWEIQLLHLPLPSILLLDMRKASIERRTNQLIEPFGEAKSWSIWQAKWWKAQWPNSCTIVNNIIAAYLMTSFLFWTYFEHSIIYRRRSRDEMRIFIDDLTCLFNQIVFSSASFSRPRYAPYTAQVVDKEKLWSSCRTIDGKVLSANTFFILLKISSGISLYHQRKFTNWYDITDRSTYRKYSCVLLKWNEMRSEIP